MESFDNILIGNWPTKRTADAARGARLGRNGMSAPALKAMWNKPHLEVNR